MNLVKNLGDHLLGAILPEVNASARCIDAYLFCKCIGQYRYVFSWDCSACYRSGYC